MANEVFKRCYQCFRPRALCFCEAVPRIENRTPILLLQHCAEKSHPFNTARIVKQALTQCELVVGHNRVLGEKELPLNANAGLLYPGADAPALCEIPTDELPGQLVVVDGTWNQAKTIVRDTPQLRNLPRYRLSPTSPGRYRIRREPTPQSLSTLEAVVSALHILEPETNGLAQLLAAFERMVDEQLARSAGTNQWRSKKSRESKPRHIPAAMFNDAGSLVVAYGESTPGVRGVHSSTTTMVNWVAQRLNDEATFDCRLQQPQPLTETALRHMNLPMVDDNEVSMEGFRLRWSQFLRPNDTLIVYHDRTRQLLQNAGAVSPRCLVLKSIFRKWQTKSHSLEDLLSAEGIQVSEDESKSRANLRMQMAVALVQHLRRQHAGAAD